MIVFDWSISIKINLLTQFINDNIIFKISWILLKTKGYNWKTREFRFKIFLEINNEIL